MGMDMDFMAMDMDDMGKDMDNTDVDMYVFQDLSEQEVAQLQMMNEVSALP